MNREELIETDIWTLYDQSITYARMMGMFSDTDLNYRMYNGDQWYGLKMAGIEPIQYNFIKPIVRYKVGIVMTNLYAINYSSENFEDRAFKPTADRVCKLLNRKAASIWERDGMDTKLRMVVKDAAINDEGIVYVTWDAATKMPTNEILNKTDVFYGNENDADIQSQPYILIKKRMPVSEAQDLAERNGVSRAMQDMIIGDNDNLEEAGDTAKWEKDPMVTVVTKLYKVKGKVRYAMATRYVDIKKDTDSGMTYYPLDHIIWEEKKGSARGEGEVRQLIPNQLETNKTAMRRAITVKNTAFQQKVVNTDHIQNPQDLDKVGATIKVSGQQVDDVAKIFNYANPAQMSPDARELLNELISSTRELAGAGEVATGQINPENASGRAILAIKQATEQPLTEHLTYTKNFVENLARIWLDMITAYSDSIKLEEEVDDPATGQKTIVIVEVPKVTLKALQPVVKVDITPKGAFDKYAQEQSMENMLTAGMFTSQRMPELKIYVSTLEDDSVMPKKKLEEAIKAWDMEQKKIANIEQQGQLLRQRAQMFMSDDPEIPVAQIMAARRMLAQGGGQAQNGTAIPQ